MTKGNPRIILGFGDYKRIMTVNPSGFQRILVVQVSTSYLVFFDGRRMSAEAFVDVLSCFMYFAGL